jgi:hypothetical protein
MTGANGVIVAQDRGVTTITLDKPETLNALGQGNGQALLDALLAADGDDDIRCVVLTGNGRGFCVGADLKEMMANRESQAGSDGRSHVPRALATDRAIYDTVVALLDNLFGRHPNAPIVSIENGAACVSCCLHVPDRAGGIFDPFIEAFGEVVFDRPSDVFERHVGCRRFAEEEVPGRSAVVAPGGCCSAPTGPTPRAW